MSEQTITSVLSDLAVVAGSIAAIYGVGAWKRESQWKKKSALAEEALCTIYEVEEAIKAIRSPLVWPHEEEGRECVEGETDTEASARNRAHVVFSRIQSHQDKLIQIRALRQKCRVLFGENYVDCFDILLKVVKDINISAFMLGMHYWAQPPEWLNKKQHNLQLEEVQRHESVIWAWEGRDEMGDKVDDAVKGAEQLFREKIEPPSIRNWAKSRWYHLSNMRGPAMPK